MLCPCTADGGHVGEARWSALSPLDRVTKSGPDRSVCRSVEAAKADAGDHQKERLPCHCYQIPVNGGAALRQIKNRRARWISPECLALALRLLHIMGIGRARGGCGTLRSDGKDYRADYEHDDLS